MTTQNSVQVKKEVTDQINAISGINKQIMVDFLASIKKYYMSERLVYAAIAQFGLDYFLANYAMIKENGITSGHRGYNHHSDTVPFYDDNREDIIDWLKERNGNIFGYESIVDIFKDSQYISELNLDEINEALYSENADQYNHAILANLLSCMIGEQICTNLSDFVEDTQ